MTMRMTGLGFVRPTSELIRRVQNGGSTMVRAGSTATVPASSAQPIQAPSVPQAAPTAATTVLDPTARGGITATHFRPDAAGPSSAAPAPVIRPGPGATSGGGIGPGSGAAYYGPSEYYGADDAPVDATAQTERKSAWLPIGLILWALFGT